jgi:cysteinyl-tRNA synthetase
VLRLHSCGPAGDQPGPAAQVRGWLLADLIRRVAEQHRWIVVASQASTSLEPEPPQDGALRAARSTLNVRPPEHAPRAPESAGLITDLIAKLIAAGHARVSGGSVYAEGPAADGIDQVLWRGAGSAGPVPGWPSPWGPGHPARAAACAAMALHYLGDAIDVHAAAGPGQDDQRERALLDAAAGHQVVRLWVRPGPLLASQLPPGRDLAGQVPAEHGLDPLAVRYAVLERHYRQPLELTLAGLRDADAALRRWRRQVAGWATSPSRPADDAVTREVAAALDDDLDTPAALAALDRLAASEAVAPGAKFETFARADQVLGLELAAEVGR